MRFLVDECAGPAVGSWLRAQSHDVVSIYDVARGSTDDQVLSMAASQQRILVTCDKDFGDKVYREKLSHYGVVLLRLKDESAASKVRAIEKLLTAYSGQLSDAFVVVTESHVRFGRT